MTAGAVLGAAAGAVDGGALGSAGDGGRCAGAGISPGVCGADDGGWLAGVVPSVVGAGVPQAESTTTRADVVINQTGIPRSRRKGPIRFSVAAFGGWSGRLPW
ncbi:hypothetical protein GCM10027403_02000 [Arthrobacter tecti]